MNPILIGFEDDLDKISAQLDLIEILNKFSGCASDIDMNDATSEYLNQAALVCEASRKVHANFPLATGTLVLYACGRFEAMTRTLFEDLCQRLVSRAGSFSLLPRKMRESLPVFTAKVISEPRRYGHAENGVRAFVATLASNLDESSALERVNHQCLSITESNMRADVLSELFSRIGGANIWGQICEQAAMKAYFEESESRSVEGKAKKKINDLMDLRNKIAHPSADLEWPSIEIVRDYLKFLRLLARCMSAVVDVYEVTLCIPRDAA